MIDVRYSVVPNEIAPLWGIELDPDAGPEEHVHYLTDRAGSAERTGELKRMLLE